ncbi:cryptochrome DASH, chloroplastic/mitochondrial [Nymphaea colorata]|nr:cryptochrome DASH, chloroplastic/mitochondrial [Nymphaea colorata]
MTRLLPSSSASPLSRLLPFSPTFPLISTCTSSFSFPRKLATSSLSLFPNPTKTTTTFCGSTSLQYPLNMSSAASFRTTTNLGREVLEVPQMGEVEMHRVAGEALQRYTSNQLKRDGRGVAIVWFRNDLRILDNEALFLAWKSSEAVLPVYCLDPRLFGTTHYFGFPKTGGFRVEFLFQSLDDLKKNLLKRGLNLLICQGKPEEILPSISEALGVHTVYAHKETCSEETLVEKLVNKGLERILLQPQTTSANAATRTPKLKLIWGSTLYHLRDLPFTSGSLPDVYTQFRKSVESNCKIRSCFKVPEMLGPLPDNAMDQFGGWGSVPSVEHHGMQKKEIDKGMHFTGGETAALARVNEYFWKKDLLKVYKETRNGLLGPDYSTKFSPWLAFGCLSPRYVYEEVMRYEKERLANNSTYWVLFELIWRDYFRFLSMKYGNSIFHLGGPRKLEHLRWSKDKNLFESWRDGRTGYPLIDANMKELSSTGFMSNRGRQIVCSFLVRDMGIDWRMGAEWFESCLVDYDPCSNYGNWTYGAGVGNDPREDRYFSIPKQAQTYDPEGEYVSYWLPELRSLPKDRRHSPGISYVDRVVPLKFGAAPQHHHRPHRKDVGRASAPPPPSQEGRRPRR